MKKFVFLMFMTFLFSSCAWFMEVFGEEINEEGIPVENIYLSLNPDKEEYRVGETINIELSGILDFNIHKNYVFELYIHEPQIYMEKTAEKYELTNNNDNYYINNKYRIHYELKEQDCKNFERNNEKERSYKLSKQIPIRFLVPSDGDVYLTFEANYCRIDSSRFKIRSVE